MFFGRIIGALIGYWVVGPFGLIIGFAVGFFFDKGLAGIGRQADPEQRAKVEQAFFDAVFPVLGCLAKSDGRISEEEIASTEHLMSRMGLSSVAREEAIIHFKKGAESDFDVDATVAEFMKVCGSLNNLRQIFLVYLITIAYADGTLHSEEEKLLQDVADKLGYSRIAFNHLLGMVKAQAHFHQGREGRAGWQEHSYQQRSASKNELDLAYQALGVDKEITDQELKKAYRRLMSEYHPDKLAGRGVPEDMVKLATERSQEIQTAYDLVKKHRKK